jgi:glycine cleavage system H protein
MVKIPNDLKYTKTHEWAKMEGDLVYFGITDYAQDQLGTIVHIELPEEEDIVARGDAVAIVDSYKASSDVYAPVSGRVVKVNRKLEEDPELLNKDPYGSWIAAIEPSNPKEWEELLDAEDYAKLVEKESH